MSLHLMTRAHRADIDYGFLGTAPNRWWRSSLPYVQTEEPALILEAVRGDVRLLVTGIPSSRRDLTGTPIRHTVVLMGRHDADDVTTVVPTLVAAGLGTEVRQRLGRVLDGSFPEKRVVELRTGSGPASDADEAVRTALFEWAQDPQVTAIVTEHTDQQRHEVLGWRLGPVGSPKSAAAVFDCVARALDGADVTVVTANIIPDRESARRVIAARDPDVPGVMLLLDGVVPKLEAVGKKASAGSDRIEHPATVDPQTGGTTSTPLMNRRRIVLGALCGGVMIALIVLIWVVSGRGHVTTPKRPTKPSPSNPAASTTHRTPTHSTTR